MADAPPNDARHAQEIAAIRAIAKTRQNDLAALCEELQRIVAHATDSERAAIYLIDHEHHELVMATTPFGYEGRLAELHRKSRLDGPFMGRVIAERSPAVFSAASLPEPMAGLAKGAGFVEFGIIPLHADGVVSGTLNLAREREKPYEPETVALALALSDLISVQIERARLNAQEKARERLAGLGELAALVAHEVRNPLGVIFNVVGQLPKHVPEGSEGATLVSILKEESARLDRIVTDFLAFGRPREPRFENVELRRLVESAVDVTNRFLRASTVEWKIEISPEASTLDADEHLLVQALVNLLTNAAEAQGSRGTVKIRASRFTHDGRDHVRLSVEDEGAEMSDDSRARAFEPFFTTKSFGTGLGLTIVKRTVEAHGGHVHIERADGGTTVTLTIPQRCESLGS